MNPAALIEELVSRGLVTHMVVTEVAASPQHAGKPVERALIDEGLVRETTVLEIMSELFGVPHISKLTPDLLDTTLAEELPHRMLENFCVYPLIREPGSEILQLACIDPFDITAIDTFRQITGRVVHLVLASKTEIEHAIHGKLLGKEGLRLLAEELPESEQLEGLGSLLEAEANELSENAAPIIRIVNSILREAVRRKASDIHIEPQEHSFRIRFRLDGILQPLLELPKRAEKTCISRIKIMSGLDISSSRGSQDGRMSIKIGSDKVNIRVSTIASFYGEKVVLRILDRSSVSLDLARLGLSEADYATLSQHFKASYGMILITGPTGSGKTSTLYAALTMLNSPAVNIVTVEDPVEYQIPGITQVQTNPRAGITFHSALRTFLRQDPDIILVGEIRDTETATTAVGAAQSGHLVLSTLHANDAPGTLSRLVMMGVQTHLLAGSLLCVVAQRLVRRLCQACKVSTEASREQTRWLATAVDGRQPRRLFRGGGCRECDGTGYRGRLGLYEVLTVTSSIREQIVDDAAEEALWRVARAEGMRTLLEDGLSKVESGTTSLDEVLRVVTAKRKPPVSPAESLAPSLSLVGVPAVEPRRVRDAMTRQVITVGAELSVKDAAELLLAHKISGGPVVDRKLELLGVVSFHDLALARPRGKRKTATARDAMSPHIITVDADAPLASAAQKMWRHRVHRLLVMEEGRLAGILTPFDLVLHTGLLEDFSPKEEQA